jgi:hypothetical protein
MLLFFFRHTNGTRYITNFSFGEFKLSPVSFMLFVLGRFRMTVNRLFGASILLFLCKGLITFLGDAARCLILLPYNVSNFSKDEFKSLSNSGLAEGVT